MSPLPPPPPPPPPLLHLHSAPAPPLCLLLLHLFSDYSSIGSRADVAIGGYADLATDAHKEAGGCPRGAAEATRRRHRVFVSTRIAEKKKSHRGDRTVLNVFNIVDLWTCPCRVPSTSRGPASLRASKVCDIDPTDRSDVVTRQPSG